ncbi:MAG: glycosyltransferase family 2 protein [Xanthomonadales bacterium]|nr:glycosyltransferase family 2 protein [Xanthomonadales bacterium]
MSVVIPAWNAAHLVGTAIDSVLAQTHADLAVLVVDDGSTDATAEVIERHARDPRVTLIRHARNRGLSAARNTGMRAARGGYMAFLDADDCWLPNHLEVAMGALVRHPELDVVFLESEVVDQQTSNPEHLWFEHHRDAFAEFGTTPIGEGFFSIDSGLLRGLLIGCVAHMQALVGRRAFIAAQMFDERLRRSEDLDWLIRATHDRGMRAAFTREVTSIYLRHGTSLTAKGGSNHEIIERTELDLFRDYARWTDLDRRERRLVRKRIAACCVDLAYYARKRGDLRAAWSYVLQGAVMHASGSQFREAAKIATSMLSLLRGPRSADASRQP